MNWHVEGIKIDVKIDGVSRENLQTSNSLAHIIILARAAP